MRAPTGGALADEIIIPGGVEEWSGRRVDDFGVGAEHTVFEWCMIYTERHPAAFLPNRNSATVKDRDDRLTLLGANWSNAPAFRPHPARADEGVLDDPVVFRTSNAVYQELAEGITTRRLDAKRVYLDDRPGELDPTLCVLNFAPILAIAQRRKDYGPSIGRLLATVAPEVPEQPRPPRETKRNAVQRYIAHIYPEGIPAGVTNKEIARATKVSPRTVQRALHSAPQPQKGQRC
jgi:hypothetical protein